MNAPELSWEGDPQILARRRIGLLCSVKCPGSLILRTYDLMRDLREESITVISGFHSPMEKECLNILLRGTCRIALCLARSLPKRVMPELHKAIDERRLLLLSPFDENQDHVTRRASAERNRLVVDLADVVFAPYASPGGMTEAVCREAIALGRPVFTFDGEHHTTLQSIGANVIAPNGVTAVLRSLAAAGHQEHVASEPSTRTASPGTRERSYCVADIRRDHPRAYAKWTEEEESRLLSLRDEGKTHYGIAEALGRQPGSVSSRLRKIERRSSQWEDKTTPE